jgi:hypothetical protein
MRSTRHTLSLLIALAVAGCATTTVSNRQTYEGPKLARPQRILVYDFAATGADIPSWASGATLYDGQEPEQTAEQIAAGRQLGDTVAKRLVSEIQSMGLNAEQASVDTPMRQGDAAIVGYFESVDEGSRLKRVALGFGAGAASMKTLVEGYQMTESGPHLLGSGEVESGGGAKGPGMIIPVAVTIATANPIGLAVGGAVKVGTELSGYDTIEGSAKRTADEVAAQLRTAFQRQGWI